MRAVSRLIVTLALIVLVIKLAIAQPRPNPWPNGQIPFGFEDSVPQWLRSSVYKAMLAIEWGSCVRFFHLPGHPQAMRIIVQPSLGCEAYAIIGRQDQNYITYGQPNCMDMNVVTHELLHAVGLAHEHSRMDAENYIIKSGYDREQGNFDSSMGMPYDYMSIMHYKERTPWFSIITRDPRYQHLIGRTQRPDAADYQKICMLYGCSQCPGAGK